MPSKNPPEWTQTPGDTTFVIALIDRRCLRAPVLMYATDGHYRTWATRSTAVARKFPTAKKAENYLKKQGIEPFLLPVVLDVPKPQPRRPKPKPIHRWLPMPFRDEPEPSPPPAVEETKPDGAKAPAALAYGDEPDPTPEQLADQERQAREAPILEAVSEQILEYMRDYARNAKGKLLRHYCKIRAEVYEAHLKGKAPAPGKPPAKTARKPPQKNFDVFHLDGKEGAVFIGHMKARNLDEAARLAPEAYKGEANIGGQVRPINPKLLIVRPTPKTTAERDRTYAPEPPKPPEPLRDVWLVTPLGQETPAYAVRGRSQGEALRHARAGADGSRFTLIPDDGRATSLELWISEPGKMEPKA